MSPEELAGIEVKDLVSRLTDEGCRNLLYASAVFLFEPYTTERIIKWVINSFDFYGIMPVDDGSSNEYHSESLEIAERVNQDLSTGKLCKSSNNYVGRCRWMKLCT